MIQRSLAPALISGANEADDTVLLYSLEVANA